MEYVRAIAPQCKSPTTPLRWGGRGGAQCNYPRLHKANNDMLKVKKLAAAQQQNSLTSRQGGGLDGRPRSWCEQYLLRVPEIPRDFVQLCRPFNDQR